MKKKHVGLIIYFLFLIIPLYWMVNCSFKLTTEIMTKLTWIPEGFTLRNYAHIFSSEVFRNPGQLGHNFGGQFERAVDHPVKRYDQKQKIYD